MRWVALAFFLVIFSGSAEAARFQCKACPCLLPHNMSSTNFVELIGAGAGGAGSEFIAGGSGGSGGGGGMYVVANNFTLVGGSTVQCQIGTGGSAGPPGTAGNAGGDTIFNGTSTTVGACSGSELCAQGGQASTGSLGFAVNVGGLGGSVSFGATSTANGGQGGTTGTFNAPGDGGGGAGGRLGAGATGGAATTNGSANGGAGGGGADGGSTGSPSGPFAPGVPGGAGGANGSAIGAGGTGGAGAADAITPGFPGTIGTPENTWGLNHGPSGGGGGGGTAATGNAGGNGGPGGICGGGGGGGGQGSGGIPAGQSSGGAGGNGCIFITYVPLPPFTPFFPNGLATHAWLDGILDWVIPSAEAASVVGSGIATTNTILGCRFTVSLSDGCLGRQASGFTVPLRLGDYQSVVDLSIDSGSGYTNGTYTWTSSGGGCTRAATGTVTVSGGLLGGQYGDNARGNLYTIADGGAGCTSRPTIAIPAGAGAGTGGGIISNVFQLTPHNSKPQLGSTYSIAGVDYPVGYDVANITLQDPTTAPLPAGATYDTDKRLVHLDGAGGTLSGYLFDRSLVVEVDVNGWTISNNKFVCDPTIQPHDSSQIQVNNTVTGTVTINFNYFDGGVTAHDTVCTTGGLTGNVSSSQASGNIVFDYNYCINAESKCFNMNGLNDGALIFVEEKYNMYINLGSSDSFSSHGEAEYVFCGPHPTETYTWDGQFNTAYNQYWSGPTNLTSQFAFAEADACTRANDVFHYNFGIAFGTQPLIGSNNDNGQVSSAVQFCGHQELGSVTNQTMTNNLHYYSGSFFPYNPTEGTCQGVLTPADFNAGTGNTCNLTTCN